LTVYAIADIPMGDTLKLLRIISGFELLALAVAGGGDI